MRVAVLGYGVEGRISAQYWRALGHEVTICDQNSRLKDVEQGIALKLGPDYLSNLDQFDIIVRTAGLNPQKILEANPQHPEIKDKITSSVNEFLAKCPSPNVIGITGTKGKGTTSTLIAKMLQAAGKTVHLGGNIGIAPLELLSKVQASDWVVLELSSFQLSDIRRSTHIAVCLMVVPEHLDWHSDNNDYFEAKTNLFRQQKDTDIAIYYADNQDSVRVAGSSPGIKIPYFRKPGAFVRTDGMIVVGHEETPIVSKDELKLLGGHNQQNVCAAITVVSQIAKDPNAMRQVLTSFTGLEHRLEFVKEVGGVKFYDDSFGTTPETAIVAMEAFPGNKVLILGGSDKGANFNKLTDEVVKEKVRHVITIGQTGSEIADQLRQKSFYDFTEELTKMDEIVKTARQKAMAGDVVLLSPACASFGLFKDYKDRGNQFKQSVLALV